MNSRLRLVVLTALVCLLLLHGCGEDDNLTPPRCLDQCELSTHSLSFGEVVVGDSADLTFVMRNKCETTLAGTLSADCDQFSILENPVYSIGGGDSAVFTVYFSPTTDGSHTCSISTGPSECGDILCSGEGVRVVVFSDDFEDGLNDGWQDRHICSDIGGYWYTVIYSLHDTGWVLMHEGGTVNGGGNGVAYVAQGISLDDVTITADITNVEAFHETAKAIGLTACLDTLSGTQYLAWYSVNGYLFLYRTSGWLSCGPAFLEMVETDPVEENQKFRMCLSVKEGLIAVRVNGTTVLTYDDTADPLPAGTVGVVATAGITYFDNIVVTEGPR